MNSPAASPLSQLGRSWIGLCLPKIVLAAAQAGQLVEDARAGSRGRYAWDECGSRARARRAPLEPLAGAGDPGRVDQPVVFQKTHEDAGKHPGRRGLGNRVAPPVREVLSRPLGLPRLLEFTAQMRRRRRANRFVPTGRLRASLAASEGQRAAPDNRSRLTSNLRSRISRKDAKTQRRNTQTKLSNKSRLTNRYN